jgi:hypothetical protein
MKSQHKCRRRRPRLRCRYVAFGALCRAEHGWSVMTCCLPWRGFHPQPLDFLEVGQGFPGVDGVGLGHALLKLFLGATAARMFS